MGKLIKTPHLCVTCCDFRKENQNSEELQQGTRIVRGMEYFFLFSYRGFGKQFKASDSHQPEVDISVGL